MNKWNWNEFWEGFYFGLNPLNSIKYIRHIMNLKNKVNLEKIINQHCIYKKPSLWRRILFRLRKDKYIDISPLKRVEIVQSIRSAESLNDAVKLMNGLARNGWLHLWDNIEKEG